MDTKKKPRLSVRKGGAITVDAGPSYWYPRHEQTRSKVGRPRPGKPPPPPRFQVSPKSLCAVPTFQMNASMTHDQSIFCPDSTPVAPVVSNVTAACLRSVLRTVPVLA